MKSVISNPFVIRSHEMSLKNGQFEISTCLESARSARYFLYLNHVTAPKMWT